MSFDLRIMAVGHSVQWMEAQRFAFGAAGLQSQVARLHHAEVKEIGFTRYGLDLRLRMAVAPTGGGPDGDMPVVFMDEPSLMKSSAWERLEYERHRARCDAADARLVLTLVCSPRAKDRNKGRRIARKRGWL